MGSLHPIPATKDTGTAVEVSEWWFAWWCPVSAQLRAQWW